MWKIDKSGSENDSGRLLECIECLEKGLIKFFK